MWESCAAVASASQSAAALKPAQFVKNVADCLDGAKEAYAEYQGIIKQLPEMIDKLLSVAWIEGLIVLSMYFVYNSFLLYDEAKNLEANAKLYCDKLEALEKEMKSFKDFIDSKLFPQWEKGNTANVVKLVDQLLEKISGFSSRLQELTQAIHQDITTDGSNQRWSAFGAVCAFVLCLGSLTVRPAPNVATSPSSGVVGDASSSGVRNYFCPAFIAIAGYTSLGYWSLSDTHAKLEKLEKHAKTMADEIIKYQSKLHLAKLEAKLKLLLYYLRNFPFFIL